MPWGSCSCGAVACAIDALGWAPHPLTGFRAAGRIGLRAGLHLQVKLEPRLPEPR